MKKTRTFYFLLSIVLLALLPSSIFAYRTNMGTINIEVGQEVKVYAEKYSTASGNWSKTGNCFYISAKSQTSCKIYGLQAGTAELKWVGVIGATDYDMYWTINVTDPNSGGNGGDSGNSGGSSECGNSDNTTSENWTTNGNYDISWYDKSKKEFSISTAKELAGFAYIVNNGYDSFAGKTIILSSNIDLSGKNWQTVGIQSSFVGGSNYFKGTFDGQNYIISGLNITKHNTNQIYYGFFGYVYGGAIIDLELRGTMNINNSDSNSSSKKRNYVGSLIGYAESCNIENCKSSVTVNYSRNVQNDAEINEIYVGGLAGYFEPGSNTALTKSVYYGNISCKQLPTSAGYYMTGSSYIGGLVGKYVSIYSSPKMEYCESDVCISVEHPYATMKCVAPQVAGLVAYGSSTIRFCRTICSININHHGFPNYDMTSGLKFYTGGICAKTGAAIVNCYAIVKDLTVSNNRSDWKLIYYGIGGSESANKSVYSNSDVTINTSLPISKELMGDTYTSNIMKTSDFLNELNTYSKLELGKEVWMLKNNPSNEREQYPSLVALNANSNISVSNIDIEDSSVTLDIGETKQLKATVSPDNATNKSVSWSSDNTNVATVGSNTGLVTAIGDGTATITCKANDGSGVTATCTVTVINPNAIDITSTNFPDANFRNWLLEQDYGKDGKFTEDEIRNITSLSVNEKNISTLKGIEFFTSLDYLNCSYNQLTSFDLSKNTALTTLYCSSNQLTSLDVTKNTALKSLHCDRNQLTSLDVTKNTALTTLNCSYNQLTSLDVSKNTALKNLFFHVNHLTSLDVSNNTALIGLFGSTNQLTSLDVSQNTALTGLQCNRNQINGKAMDELISSLPYNSSDKTYEFYVISPSYDDEGNVCTKSQVAATKAKGWTPLYYNGNEWQEYEGSEDSNAIEINSTNFPDDNFRNWLLGQDYGKDGKLTEDEIKNITSISVSNKNISTLKGIEFFTSLIELQCWSNQLTSLDVSKNTALTWLSCYSNQLTSLDVSKNTALTQLDCYYNQLTTLDVSKNTALKYMQCGANQLISLNVSNTALTQFNCHLNQIKGKAMDELINSLPYNSSDEIYKFQVISPSYDDEGNVCTKNQVAAIKAKGWTAYCLVGNDWQEYEGSDEYQYAKGDVNMDNTVNGTDLVALSNIVLGRKDKTETADVNGDGSVNGTDIVALSNIILGRNNNARSRAPETGASLSIEPFDIKAGETKELLIDLTNPNDEMTLVQFDLHLPVGLSIKKNGSDLDFDMAGRTSWRKHTLDANEVDDAYRFLLYSSGNTLIEGTNGAIIKVNIVADETFNGGKIVLDNILLVDPNEKETKPEIFEYVIPTLDDGSAKLSVEPFDIAKGETKEMQIDLSNPNDEVTLVQFDLHLPTGLSIKKSGSDLDFDMGGRTSWRKHTLDANEIDGAYRFLLYSSGNTLIEGTSGAIIKMSVVADESFNGGKIVLDNILLVDPNEKEMKPARYEYEIGSGSGISSVKIDTIGKRAHIYNLSGQKLSAPKKGINIIGGKKVVVK